MNEGELKQLFWDSLRSGHINNNDIIPISDTRIVDEAHFRSFDLLIAAVTKEPVEGYEHYNNLLMRTQLFESFARSAKCMIDCVRFYPVELKSDDDVLDERLPSQILNAILAFGLSVVVLDKAHSKKARSLKFLPATIIGYTGKDDFFEVLSKYDRLVSTGPFNLNRTSVARILGPNGGKAFTRLAAVERILQKLAFNQVFFDTLGLDEEEIEFLRTLSGIHMPSAGRGKLSRLVNQTANMKLTDYV